MLSGVNFVIVFPMDTPIPLRMLARCVRAEMRQDAPFGVFWRLVTPTAGFLSISTGSFFWLPNMLGSFTILDFRLSNGMTPASFALVERVDQFLNERTQYRRVAFTCNRRT